MKPCPNCAGSGTEHCNSCNGTGRMGDDKVCTHCHGMGVAKCPQCGGTGKAAEAAS